jgi:hypothetical protein
MSKFRKISSAIPFVGAAMLLAVAPVKADTVTTFGSTVGTGPWQLTSACTPSCPPYTEPVPLSYSGLDIQLSTPIAFSTLAVLSATFVDQAGGAEVGSPRFGIYTTGGDYFTVYLGTPPNFSDSDPAAFTAAYSGTNLNNGTTNSTFQLENTLQTLAALQATYGSDLVNEVALFVDGGYGANGPQSLTVSGITINNTTYSSSLAAAAETPLPAALPLFASGLGALGFVGWRKRRKRAA